MNIFTLKLGTFGHPYYNWNTLNQKFSLVLESIDDIKAVNPVERFNLFPQFIENMMVQLKGFHSRFYCNIVTNNTCF